MKKYFAIFAVLFTVILSSCSNDDIEVIDSCNFQLSVSTQSVYDDLGMSEDFRNRFLGADKDYSIGVYSFIYDTDGNLAASDSTYVDTFGRVTQEFNGLKTGNYTLVTLEMLVDKSDGYSSPNWLIAGQDRLETIAIFNKSLVAYWYSAVGLYTSEFSFSKGNSVKEVIPKGIGCTVRVSYNNFDFSKYACVGFFTKDEPKGRLLSPFIGETDRFVYDDYNESNVWNYRGYRYPGEDGFDNSEVQDIYLLEEGLIRYCFGAQTLEPNGDLSSFIAYPSRNTTFQVNDGEKYYGGFVYIGGDDSSDCEARLFSLDSDYQKWLKNIDLNFAQNSNYVKPYLSWGASANEVNTYMTDAGLQLRDSGNNNETGTYWAYYTNTVNTVSYEYQFDLNQKNLNVVFMNFDKNNYTFDFVKSDLTQSYEEGVYSEDLDGYFFASDDTMLLLYETDSVITVLYVPNVASSTKLIPAKIANFKLKSEL